MSHETNPFASEFPAGYCEAIGLAAARADAIFASGGTRSNLQALLMTRDLFAEKAFGWGIGAQGIVTAGLVAGVIAGILGKGEHILRLREKEFTNA